MVRKVAKLFFLILTQIVVLVVILLALNSIFYHPPAIGDSVRIHVRKSFAEYKENKQIPEDIGSQLGAKKDLPENFKKQALIALSFFPELKNVHVEFIEKEASFPLSSYPDPLTLLIPGCERKYKIIISTKSLKEYDSILLHKLPFDAQIGVLGHELAHTSFYIKKPSIEIALLGLKYLVSSSFRRGFEKETDRSTIDHGLGYQLLDWRSYFEGLSTEEQKFGSKIYFEDRYLSASEIRSRIRQNEIYH